MNLQDLFNLAARKGQASTIFVPQKQQPSYFETASRAPQKASSIFVPAVSTQMPSYLETAGQYAGVSPLFKFPTKEKEPTKPKKEPVILPAGTVQPTAIVSGLTPAGEVDRSQSDEYKSQMAQYRNLIAKEKQQEAKDLGMEIWKQKYADTAMAQPGGAIGSYNPLLARMFPETRGYAGTFAPIEEIQKGDLGTRAQPEGGWTLESLNPEAQQEATAAQAKMATTAGMPVLSPRERAQLLIRSI